MRASVSFSISRNRLEEILPIFAQNDFLPHLEGRHPLAILHAFPLTIALIVLQQHAAALQHLRKLMMHFGSKKLGYRQPGQ